jgi:hypothetical protein
MNKYLNFILIIILFSLLNSCSSFDTVEFESRLNTWLNHDKTELIKSWGPPSRIESDMNGGQIFIYDNSAEGQTGGLIYTNPKTGLTTYTTPQKYTKYLTTMMYVNQSGKIYHWRYETNY